MTAIRTQNTRRLFDAHPGLLGDTLARAGWHAAAAIANADRTECAPRQLAGHRDAALALMSHAGRVDGSVSSALLRPDPAAPCGVRLNDDAVVNTFAPVWNDRTVVLVEASDLARVEGAAPHMPAAKFGAQFNGALGRTDTLIGRLLQLVDVRRAAVLVVAPYHSIRRSELTVAALRAPGVPTGMLRSPSTRRSGFVELVDVAPTVLQLGGIARPSTMEGRPVAVGTAGSSLASRVHALVDADRAARFRDEVLHPVEVVVVVVSLLAAALTVVIVTGRARRLRALLQSVALALLGLLIATDVAGVAGFERRGVAAYWAFLLAVSVAFAASCVRLGRRDPSTATIAALGALVLLHVGDALVGARLEFNTVFGYSPIIGIRLAGLGNMAFAQLSAAALVLAGLVAARVGGRPGTRAALAILGVTVLIIGSPWWGQNFGGALAVAPVFVLVALLLTRRRVRARTVALLVAIPIVAGLAIGSVDLLRPAQDRTHVGRFFEKVQSEGWRGFALVIHRKANESVATLHHSIWVWLTGGVVLFLAFIAWFGTRRLPDLGDRAQTLRPVIVGLPLLLVLGLALKDSGIAVPGMMLVVVNAIVVYLALRLTSPTTRRV